MAQGVGLIVYSIRLKLQVTIVEIFVDVRGVEKDQLPQGHMLWS